MSHSSPVPQQRQARLAGRISSWLGRRAPAVQEIARFAAWAARVLLGGWRGLGALALAAVAFAGLGAAAMSQPEGSPVRFVAAAAAGFLVAGGLAMLVVAYVRIRFHLAREVQAATFRAELERAGEAQSGRVAALEGRIEDRLARLDEALRRQAGQLERENAALAAKLDRRMYAFRSSVQSNLAESTTAVRQRADQFEEALAAKLDRRMYAFRISVHSSLTELASAVGTQFGELAGRQTQLERSLDQGLRQVKDSSARDLRGLEQSTGAAVARLEAGRDELRRFVSDAVSGALDRMNMVEQTAEQATSALASAHDDLARTVDDMRDNGEGQLAALKALLTEESVRNAANAKAASELTALVAERIRSYRADLAGMRRGLDELRARPIGQTRAQAEQLAAQVRELETRLAQNVDGLRDLVAQAEARGAEQAKTWIDEAAGRVESAERLAEAAKAAAEAASRQVTELAVAARERANRLTSQADAMAKATAEARAAAEQSRQANEAAAKARAVAEEAGKTVAARSAAAEEEAKRAVAVSERSLRILSRMGDANAALARPFDRMLSDEVISRLEKHWIKVLGLNLSRSAVAYLAHQICLAEDRCEGRIAAPIETVLLRLMAMRSLHRDSLEVLEVGTLFGIAAGVLHRLGGGPGARVNLTLLDPLEGYYKAGALDPITGAPIERRVLERNLQALGVPTHEYRLIQRRSEEPEAREEARDRLYDLVVLDGDHSTAGVAHDFETYGPMVKPGGLLLFDDYGSDHWPGIKPYVDEHARNDPDWTWIGGEYRTGIIRRRVHADQDAKDADAGNIRRLRADRAPR